MGWLWASASPPKPSSPVDDKTPSTATEQKPAPNEPKFDPAVQEFINMFSTEAKKPEDPKPRPPTTTAEPSQGSSSSWFSLKASKTTQETPNAPPRSPLSESLLPTEMSCRNAFDLAWACNSIGGQWNAVYREGEMRSCSEQWDDFWFCMRQKSSSGPVKEEAVRTHYRNREFEKYYAPGKRSSEDIWQPREVRLQNTFSEPID